MTTRVSRLALVFAVLAVRTAAAQETPQQTVQRLISLPHGLERLAPEDRQRLDRAKANPAPYAAAVADLIPNPTTEATRDRESLQRVQRAALLLGALGPAAADRLGQWFVASSDAAATAGDARQRAALASIQHVTLTALDGNRRDPVVTRIFADLPRMAVATRVTALDYLTKVAPSDTTIRTRLQSMRDDPRSPLYNDATLRAALGRMGVR